MGHYDEDYAHEEEMRRKSIAKARENLIKTPHWVKWNEKRKKFLATQMKTLTVAEFLDGMELLKEEPKMEKEEQELKRQEQIRRLRETTGSVHSEDPLVDFLYNLMRDHLPTGVVEELVVNTQIFQGNTVYTNGHLALYAMDLARRLR